MQVYLIFLNNFAFWRLRLGTGHPRSLGMAQPVADFVLHRPSREHQDQIQECITAALKTCGDIATGDMARVQRALAKFGTPRTPAKDAEKEAEKENGKQQ